MSIQHSSNSLFSQNIEIDRHMHDKQHTKKNIKWISIHDNSSLKINCRPLKLSSFKHLVNEKNNQQNEINFEYFKNKYTGVSAQISSIFDEMHRILHLKKYQIQSLKVYRDQLKLIHSSLYSQTCHDSQQSNQTSNKSYSSRKISVLSLKQKADQQELIQQKININNKIYEHFFVENVTASLYLQYLSDKFGHDYNTILSDDKIDMSKQQQILVRNLQMETNHISRQLEDGHKKNNRQIRIIQDDILTLRIQIKQKQDRLRDLNANICTLYMKLNNRNSSKAGSKPHNRNVSLSIRKFNDQNHQSIHQLYVGNTSFKNYSHQVLEKVSTKDELLKIRFYCPQTNSNNKISHNGTRTKQIIKFQCIYKSCEGMIHSENIRQSQKSIDSCNDATRDRISQNPCAYQQVDTKYLLSIKFYYKSQIVGVQYRVKTNKGNKHIKLGCCTPNIEHQLVTLINKKIITLGSFWHNGLMIGISLWMKHKHESHNHESTQKSKKILRNNTNIYRRISEKQLNRKVVTQQTINHKNQRKHNIKAYEQYFA